MSSIGSMRVRIVSVLFLLVGTFGVRPSHIVKHMVSQSELAREENDWTKSATNKVCHDPETCGVGNERCRDVFCGGCGLGNCSTLQEAQNCCLESASCTAVYGGGAHWWTFSGQCDEEEHQNFYNVWHRVCADLSGGYVNKNGATWTLAQNGCSGHASRDAGGITWTYVVSGTEIIGHVSGNEVGIISGSAGSYQIVFERGSVYEQQSQQEPVYQGTVFVPKFVMYPDYVGPWPEVRGSMSIDYTDGSTTSMMQTLRWSLTGLDSACTAGAADHVTNGCGIHIHSGSSCATAAEVGGHYFSADIKDDPWKPVVYEAKDDLTSNEYTGVAVTTGLSVADILGKAMVVHQLESGARIACGIIGAETAADQPDVEVDEFVPYPGSTWPPHFSGILTIEARHGSSETATQTLRWQLLGMDSACKGGAADGVKNGCGIHVHHGTSCTSADAIGGHYFSDALTADPWADVRYVTESADMSLEIPGVRVVTGNSNGDITGRVIVVHELESGRRIGCGVIKRSSKCKQQGFAPPPLGSDRGRCGQIDNEDVCRMGHSESGCPCVWRFGFFPTCDRVCPGDGTDCSVESNRHCCAAHQTGMPGKWCSWNFDRQMCSEMHLD